MLFSSKTSDHSKVVPLKNSDLVKKSLGLQHGINPPSVNDSFSKYRYVTEM